MPTIENPEPFPVFCLPIREVLAAGEIREVTEDEALAASESSVFRVHDLTVADTDAALAAAKADEEAEAAAKAIADAEAAAAAAAEAEQQAAAARVASQRGATVVETTAPPEAETR